MELIFVRHGQGEHTLSPPESLQLNAPSLTEEGVNQISELKRKLSLNQGDLLVSSPTRRTIETATLLANGTKGMITISPAVSPRMFPQNSKWKTLPCDKTIEKEFLKKDLPNVELEDSSSEELWRRGINTIPEHVFKTIGNQFLDWCRQQHKEKIFIVSHDGTITSYRQLITGSSLSRKDFLKDGGWVRVYC